MLISVSIMNLSLKPLSHSPCGSRTLVCDDNFPDFARQLHDVVSNTSRVLYKKTRSQDCRNFKNLRFRHVFFAISVCFLEEARQLQDYSRHARCSYDRRYNFATHAFVLRKPQDYHKITVRFIARLPQECCEKHDYS